MTHNGPQSEQTADLHSVHTSNLPELFEQLQISLIVSTYQAGKAIVVRNDGSATQERIDPPAQRGRGEPAEEAGDRRQ